MPLAPNKIRLAGALALGLMFFFAPTSRCLPQTLDLSEDAIGLTTITNMAQLTSSLAEQSRVICNIRLEGTVCAASKTDLGVLVIQDDTGVELLELGRRPEKFTPGDRIRIEGNRVLLRRRDLGTQISAAPVVDNDGLHALQLRTGKVVLKAGRVPLEVDWFNRMFDFGLDVSLMQSNGQTQAISDSALSHLAAESSPRNTNLLSGLQVEAYEDDWLQVPDFDLLIPVKTGTATNFDLAFCPRDELVGLRFTGFFDAPTNGTYTFSLTSDDGSLLFMGRREVAVQKVGTAQVPATVDCWIGQPMNQIEERRWLSVEGRVSSVLRKGHSLELELSSGADSLSVGVADADGLDPAGLLNSRVRAVGVGRAALSSGGRIVLSRLSVVSGGDLRRVSPAGGSANSLPLVGISQVQNLSVEEATRQLPVRVRGVVTAASRAEHWFSLQDDTRGIFVHCNFSNSFPRSAEFWEVIGHTAPGNFAPTIEAEKIERLGRATMPEPARPGWNELANGSMDAQWVEFRGVVSDVQSNRLTFLLPEGTLEATMENHIEADLKQYLHTVVRVRGTLFAIWNAGTREVQFGNVLMRNATVSLEVQPPANPFDAPAKSARDLLRFDVQATAFSPVKVRAQVLCADAQNIFAMDDGAGLRVQAANVPFLRPGDWFEAVGYPEISGPSPLLRYAVVRKSGAGSLPKPKVLDESDLRQTGLDSTLVAVEGSLVEIHSEQGSPVLEMQSKGHLFVARLKTGTPQLTLRPGSRLQLAGVYVQTGVQRRPPNQVESFELLLNSVADISVLSQPSWWTLKRLASVVGFLLLVLLLAAAWISQLRRQVEQRTIQLRKEISQREHAERQHAIEAERSRIARDLHDDLGSGLSEINLLVGARQQRSGEDGNDSPLFRKIASKTRGLIAALDVIVWAVDPEDNSLQSLADYLNGFVAEFLSHSGLACRLKVPIIFPAVMLDGQVRHGLLMAVKEAINNVVRHADATEVEFRLTMAENILEIVVADNGKGFDPLAQHDGRGLKHLSPRLVNLGGSCQVESATGHGTTVKIRLPLNAPAPADSKLLNRV